MFGHHKQPEHHDALLHLQVSELYWRNKHNSSKIYIVESTPTVSACVILPTHNPKNFLFDFFYSHLNNK